MGLFSTHSFITTGCNKYNTAPKDIGRFRQLLFFFFFPKSTLSLLSDYNPGSILIRFLFGSSKTNENSSFSKAAINVEGIISAFWVFKVLKVNLKICFLKIIFFEKQHLILLFLIS